LPRCPDWRLIYAFRDEAARLVATASKEITMTADENITSNHPDLLSARASVAGQRRATFLIALMLVLAASSVRADSAFGNADLRGSYAWSLDGTAFGTSLDVVRQFIADGQGTFSVEGIVNFGTGAVPHTLVCRYSVKSNGLGTARCNSPELGEEHFAFVLVDKGNEVRFISTTAGVIIKGVARRQSSPRD
jgi:hypothetical protein